MGNFGVRPGGEGRPGILERGIQLLGQLPNLPHYFAYQAALRRADQGIVRTDVLYNTTDRAARRWKGEAQDLRPFLLTGANREPLYIKPGITWAEQVTRPEHPMIGKRFGSEREPYDMIPLPLYNFTPLAERMSNSVYYDDAIGRGPANMMDRPSAINWGTPVLRDMMHFYGSFLTGLEGERISKGEDSGALTDQRSRWMAKMGHYFDELNEYPQIYEEFEPLPGPAITKKTIDVDMPIFDPYGGQFDGESHLPLPLSAWTGYAFYTARAYAGRVLNGALRSVRYWLGV